MGGELGKRKGKVAKADPGLFGDGAGEPGDLVPKMWQERVSV